MKLEIVHTLSLDTKAFVQSLADAIRHTISMQLKLIMSKLDNYIAAQQETNAAIETAVDGLVADVATLNQKIADLQANIGELSPEQTAALNDLGAHSTAIAAKLKALDEVTPPPAPGS